MPLDQELVEILACPITGSKLRLSEDGQWLISDEGRVRFPVVDDIPHLIKEEAQPVEDES